MGLRDQNLDLVLSAALLNINACILFEPIVRLWSSMPTILCYTLKHTLWQWFDGNYVHFTTQGRQFPKKIHPVLNIESSFLDGKCTITPLKYRQSMTIKTGHPLCSSAHSQYYGVLITFRWQL